ncbi:unnamed protein product [Angiostrongylus costaricensis]|uniref:FHA domain-containing protein n=1 Tax=Angiostrongylus costaricensis TaxID=334426 RepID=A0A0R3PHF3_ANGCS|nr:unnamed protein product [Angiostrongylus costaricensis]
MVADTCCDEVESVVNCTKVYEMLKRRSCSAFQLMKKNFLVKGNLSITVKSRNMFDMHLKDGATYVKGTTLKASQQLNREHIHVHRSFVLYKELVVGLLSRANRHVCIRASPCAFGSFEMLNSGRSGSMRDEDATSRRETTVDHRQGSDEDEDVETPNKQLVSTLSKLNNMNKC